jgi:alpha 1,3-glucosidase
MFALGYHQCRWNYNDEEDVLTVNKKLDEHNIPADVIWLDIDHANDKRYFTWDMSNFPDPIKMQNEVASVGRKMVTIVDPHLKKDTGFHVYSAFRESGGLVKNKYGDDFEGNCWPGNSSWPDFLRPEVRALWVD